MIKKLLIRLASDAVLELLLVFARKRYEDVRTAEEKEKWQIIVNFLLEAQKTGLPL